MNGDGQDDYLLSPTSPPMEEREKVRPEFVGVMPLFLGL